MCNYFLVKEYMVNVNVEWVEDGVPASDIVRGCFRLEAAGSSDSIWSRFTAVEGQLKAITGGVELARGKFFCFVFENRQ